MFVGFWLKRERADRSLIVGNYGNHKEGKHDNSKFLYMNSRICDRQSICVRPPRRPTKKERCDRQTKPCVCATTSSDEREQEISHRIVGSKILHTSPTTRSLQTFIQGVHKVRVHFKKFITFFFVLYLLIFILHSRECEMYRYILDGTSALAWELPFFRCLGHLSST